MIEKIVLDFLNDNLTVPGFMEENSEMPRKYVIIEKTGGGVSEYLKRATIVIQSYADTLYEAAVLNENVKDVMEHIVDIDDITKCSLNSDYNFTDTTRKKYRYQSVFDVTYY